MVIIDSSVMIAFLDNRRNPHTDWLFGQRRSQRIGITSLTQVEILQGIGDEARFLQVLEKLNAFKIFETGSSLLSIAAARNYRLLRKSGITIRSTIDCLIATFCILEGHTLLHNDRDFDPFESRLGLNVVRPPQSPLY